jgi:hypothetical protein
VTAALEETAEWPEGVLFWPPRSIPYQVDYIARMTAMGSGGFSP